MNSSIGEPLFAISGTYLFHIEAINFSTGKTTWDVAPVVVGVRP